MICVSRGIGACSACFQTLCDRLVRSVRIIFAIHCALCPHSASTPRYRTPTLEHISTGPGLAAARAARRARLTALAGALAPRASALSPAEDSRHSRARNECPAKYGMKRCSDGMFSACRARAFQPLFFVFFIFRRATHGNTAERASPRPRLLPSRAAFASHCFSGQLWLESPTFRPSLCSAATPAGRAGTNHPQLHNE